MPKLTNAERYTWETIQENYEKIPNLSISELAEMAHVSLSTINRTVRKKGYEGYGEFRYSIKEKKLPEISGFSEEILVAISKNEEEILKTIGGISAESVEKAVKMIDEAEEIFLFARGLSTSVAQEMMKKLQLWHKRVTIFDEGRTMRYFSDFMKPQSLIIAISLFGATEEILVAIEKAKIKKAKVLALTASEYSPLVESADVSLVGYKSSLEVNFFELDVHSRLPLYVLVRILFDSYQIYKNK
ncbi:MurR/RpiR family transcriptional regulator [Lactococcus kimchii]|uniref:MurR/RpiR family transcriptional regulator n=1 Tax=Lactococcus sp. S-13 TaxID=2507158 RepID=UPI001023F357|nr:MurR/RpiR family transcriptional regulator [Lactococcus sp. S-13]RZI49148.1 MurR/RpiR family transcriptional regulator [Lactococcus sp. S-13]